MVTIFCSGVTAETGREQERTATPSRWTVQAPHCAMPQPYFVPVRPTCSRITQRSGVSGSASTSRTTPLTSRRTIASPEPVPVHIRPTRYQEPQPGGRVRAAARLLPGLKDRGG